ncbi:DNA-binding transcriptional response regulator [Kibdelosporangium aridum]|uniref:response regulator n=1 Tax=Kibdelosporangium aridum TaxID=2030 RepID=UPI001179D326|nr:response regulator [Kibdelosporangium aridum]
MNPHFYGFTIESEFISRATRPHLPATPLPGGVSCTSKYIRTDHSWCSEGGVWVLTRKKNRPELPLSEIILRVRILVIDDQDFPYIKLFKRDGYTIEKWRDVTSIKALEQGQYDLILLDLQGVGARVSIEDQGLGVLKHIKQVRPSQLVIAYSNAEFPVKYQSFFELADGVLPKSADYFDFKRKVDDLLRNNFSLGFHMERISTALNEVGLSGRKDLKLAKKAVRRGDTSALRQHLSRTLDNVTVEKIVSIAQLAINVTRLWTQ